MNARWKAVVWTLKFCVEVKGQFVAGCGGRSVVLEGGRCVWRVQPGEPTSAQPHVLVAPHASLQPSSLASCCGWHVTARGRHTRASSDGRCRSQRHLQVCANHVEAVSGHQIDIFHCSILFAYFTAYGFFFQAVFTDFKNSKVDKSYFCAA